MPKITENIFPILLPVCALFSLIVPGILSTDTEQDTLAELYLKTANVFLSSQNITPSPDKVYPGSARSKPVDASIY
jgi:hypothetical protein